MKLMFIVGTRPEAIKQAPVIIEAKQRAGIETIVVTTGQHKQMLDQMLKVFEITPDVDLSIMKHNQDLRDITTSALDGLYTVIDQQKPDWVLVQGDTTTTFTGALAAFYHQVPVAHIEAGLRTFDKSEPFPEEVNRCITSQLASIHFPPTKIAKDNLLNEGIDKNQVLITGNTAIDALKLVLNRLQLNSAPSKNLKHSRTVLVTAHRRENHGKRMNVICDAILALLEKFEDIDVLFPVHMSPRVRDVVFAKLSDHSRIRLVDPLDYVSFIKAMHESYLILTDSGGIQEEAPSLGKPVIVLRDQTERPEASMVGTAILVGASFDKIVKHAGKLLSEDHTYQKMAKIENPYGDGNAAKKIIDAITRYNKTLYYR